MKTLENIDKILSLIHKKADQLELNAGLAGRHDDGGASKLRNQAVYYELGKSGSLPDSWKKYIEEVLIKEDPEYSNYLRLKKKFEE